MVVCQVVFLGGFPFSPTPTFRLSHMSLNNLERGVELNFKKNLMMLYKCTIPLTIQFFRNPDYDLVHRHTAPAWTGGTITVFVASSFSQNSFFT